MSNKSKEAQDLVAKIEAAREEGRNEGILGGSETREDPNAFSFGEKVAHVAAAVVTGGASLIVTALEADRRSDEKADEKAVLDAAYSRGYSEGKAIRESK